MSTKVIKRIDPLRNTTNGNLRLSVVFTDGTVASTVPDGNIGRRIGNTEFQNVPLDVTFDSKGYITDVEVTS